ncbi:MAG: hypothetical protein M3017_01245 [Actinomycetota bacterium]|nr:hypothetical protein [Actinomycetota bacterium]
MVSLPWKADAWLLHRIPSERTRTLLSSAADREELVRFDEKLAALKARIASREAPAAEIEYIFGITNDLTAP